MRKRYKAGEIGEVEYAEGEYIHNCECEWFSLTQGNPEHWRNNMYSTFYCTHSIGPMIHITDFVRSRYPALKCRTVRAPAAWAKRARLRHRNDHA